MRKHFTVAMESAAIKSVIDQYNDYLIRLAKRALDNNPLEVRADGKTYLHYDAVDIEIIDGEMKISYFWRGKPMYWETLALPNLGIAITLQSPILVARDTPRQAD